MGKKRKRKKRSIVTDFKAIYKRGMQRYLKEEDYVDFRAYHKFSRYSDFSIYHWHGNKQV